MAEMSLKQRVEATFINLLSSDSILAAAIPKPQVTKERKDVNPRIAVTFTQGKEYEVQAGIFNGTVTIELFYNIPQNGQDDGVMEDSARRVDAIIAATQAGGRFGITRTGGSASLSGVVAKRTITLSIIAA